jgi:hypothetical protein
MKAKKKTLVIHNADKSTDFLIPIYKGMHNKTVLRGNVSNKELIELIKSHDRIMMMGHGWTSGLFNINGIGEHGLTINSQHVELLRKKECIFIWCKAHVFVEHFGLKGFNTDMFISEVGEARWFQLNPTQAEVDEANNTFVNIFKHYRTLDSETMLRRTKLHYGVVAKRNKVAQFNYDRLYNNT